MTGMKPTRKLIATLPTWAADHIHDQRRTLQAVYGALAKAQAERDTFERSVREMRLELDRARARIAELVSTR